MKDTSSVIPVDEFVRDELYPGYTQEFGSQPFVVDPVRPFRKADNEQFWLRDSMHFGSGLVPASIALLEDAQTWGTQLGAEMVGVPTTKGMVNRLAGTHVYIGQIGVDSAWQMDARAARFSRFVSPILEDFQQYWARCAEELQAAYDHFDSLDLAAMNRDELWTALQDAYVFHRRGWYIHFEVMYALGANYLSFYQLAGELGLDQSLVSRYLAGEWTSYMETDERMWQAARRAGELGLADTILHADPARVREQLHGSPEGRRWWGEFEQFLGTYGQRTEETCTINAPPWAEDPTPPLRTIQEFLRRPEGHDFYAARQSVIDERERLVDEARTRIGGGQALRSFDDALASNRAANFVWWSEEHNYLIDRRIHIPVRRVSLQLAAHLVDEGKLDEPEDIFFLFKPELFGLMQGHRSDWAGLRSVVPQRRAYYEEWRERGPELPAMVGAIPDRVDDPLMTEVFGLSPEFLATVKSGAPSEELGGFPASKGVVEGTARVIHAARDLDQVQLGEILVCGGTTTEWTPVFGVIRACVCDTGGSLAHAAIVSREYGIPCVVGTAAATSTIETGDRVRVDGTGGTVQVTKSHENS